MVHSLDNGYSRSYSLPGRVAHLTFRERLQYFHYINSYEDLGAAVV
jgi:hypothetical protein